MTEVKQNPAAAIFTPSEDGSSLEPTMLLGEQYYLETGLSAADIGQRRLSIAPDQDALILNTGEDQFAILRYAALNNSGIFSDPYFKSHPIILHEIGADGMPVEGGRQLAGGVAQVIDHVENNSYFMEMLAYEGGRGNVHDAVINNIPYPIVVHPGVSKPSNLKFCDQVIIEVGGQKVQVILPEEFPDVNVGENLTITTVETGTPVTQTGKIIDFRAADMQDVEVMTSDGTVMGGLRFVEDPDNFNPSTRPFEDNLLVVSEDGSFYQLNVPANFGGFKEGDTLMIGFAAVTPDGRPTQDKFRTKIVKFSNVESKTKYRLEKCDLSIIAPDDQTPIVRNHKAQIEKLIAENNPFEEGKEYKNFTYREKVKKLQKSLLKYAYGVEVMPEWVAKNKSFKINIRVTTPPQVVEPEIIFDDNTTQWLLDKLGSEEKAIQFREILADEVEKNIPYPYTADKLTKYSARKISQLNRKHPEFSFQMGNHYVENGVLHVAIGVQAKPQGAFIKIMDGGKERSFDSDTLKVKHNGLFDPNDEKGPLEGLFRGKKKRAEEKGSIIDSDEEDPLDEKESVKVVKRMFHKISETLADENEILIVKRGGKTMPYQPTMDFWAASQNKLQLTAYDMDGTTEIPIETYNAKNLKFEFNAPKDDKGKEIGPRDARVENMFQRGNRFTAESIAEGISKLTQWYTKKGYALVDGHLDYEIINGKLKIDAKVYRLDGDIEFTWAEPDYEVAGKREPLSDKLKQKIMNEFKLKDGDLFDQRSFERSVASVNSRFRFVATPVRIPQADGTIKLGLVVTHIKWEDILNMLTLEGGYDTNGITITGNYDLVMKGGYKLNANATASPFASVYGAGVGVSTPADKHGGHWGFSTGGTYQGSDTFYGEGVGGVSSLGAAARYTRPIGNTDWSWFGEMGASYLFGDDSIEGTGALYGKPSVGLRYDGTDETGDGLSAEIFGGPRFSRYGVYGELGASANYRKNIDEWGEGNRVYAEAWAKAGILIGNAPEAAMWQSAPTNLMGVYTLQSPIKAYGSVGASLMTETPGDILDVGVGASAGFMGPVWAVGAGLRFKVRVPGMGTVMTLMIGPSLINGVPTPIAFLAG